MKSFLFNEYHTMISAATEKGLSIWREKSRYWDEMIGIENKNAIVYWYDVTDDGYLSFNHCYNRNNGKTTKGYKMGFNFKYKMIYK